MASLPPLASEEAQAPPYQSIDEKSKVDLAPLAMDVDAPKPDRRGSRTPSTFSMDDIEVAKALTGLREGESRRGIRKDWH